jgi:uncharacterized surface protein with fasciclin (FAS1) repeats
MHHHMGSSRAAHHSAANAAAMIGSDCGMVPAYGTGSMHSMAMQPLTTAAASNHLLAGYAAAVEHAGLAHELDARHGVTIFAPQTSAFMHLPSSEMGMMHHAGELAKIIKYTVVGHTVTPTDLAHGGSLTTLEGSPVTASKMGGVYEIGNAAVACGPIRTENGTIYLTNKLLIPVH